MKQSSANLGKLILSKFKGGGFNIKIDSPLLLGPALSSFSRLVLVVSGPVFDLFNLLWKDRLNTYHLIEDSGERGLVSGFESPSFSAYQSGLRGFPSGALGGVLLVSDDFYKNGVIKQDRPPPSYVINESTHYSDLLGWLESLGYVRVDIVVSGGEFAVRGGVVDFYPISGQHPVRCSFLDDCCKIFHFNVGNQISFRSSVDSVVLFVPNGGEGVKLSVADVLGGFPVAYFCPKSGVFSGGDGSFKKNISICKNYSYDSFSVVDSSLKSFGYKLDGVVYRPEKYFFSPNGGDSKNVDQDYFRPHDIEVGDYVVHEDFGVGIMLGLVEEGGEDVGFAIKLNDGVVSVDLSRSSKVSFFATKNTAQPLGSLSKKGAWSRKKRRALEESNLFVESLVAQYAKRQLMSRVPYKIDLGLEKEFIDSFGHTDTVDQASSWEDIKNDLQGVLPMNRLLCGDVGFGKTEIAIRTSFIAALNQKRVVVLCPTTVLCKQLFDSFRSRLKNFGVNVGMVSRLNKNKNNNENISDFNGGKIDVLVGTHALINKGSVLDRVNLLIVDEEQRFGVHQKEVFVNMNNNIDLLFMSATPIPRSLQLSLYGIRDLSLLQTPPKNRLPIQTRVVRVSRNLIKSSIIFEIERGGQVYFLNNNIREMSYYSAMADELGVRYEIVHGKMTAEQIKNKMFRFVQGEVDVLFSTTIIENGIDVPRANTILINDAHLFGVSQLHQIRGRVGRSFYQGFAYLMVPKNLKIEGDIKNRLLALETNIVLGSGYALSNKDLEIRGGGTPFGYKQSGLSWGLGFELYGKIIRSAIEKNKNPNSFDVEDFPSINLGFGEKIPRSFLPSEFLRISFYNLITKADSLTAINALVCEITDRFGKPPKDLLLLIEIRRLSIRCRAVGVLGISKKNNEINIFLGDFSNKNNNHSVVFLNFVNKFFIQIKYNFKHLSNNRLVVSFQYSGNKLSLIELLNKFINGLETL